jgi:MFS family permease
MVYLAFRPDIRGLLRLIAWTSATAGAALIVFSFATSFWIALPALYFVGMGMMLSAASTNTVLQSIVPDELRGRVAALYVMSFIGASPLGALLAGWIAERVGPPITLAGCGIAALAAALAYASMLPAIRREIRPVYEKLGIFPQ